MFIRVSEHIITKPNEYQKDKHVDAAEGGALRKCPEDIFSERASPCDRRKENALTWGGLPNHGLDWEKSADAIVATGNEPLNRKGGGLAG